MIFVKYNRRYHFFDEDLYNASDSSSKHFANYLATRAATKIFPCKNKKIENSVLKEGVEATVSILVPFLEQMLKNGRLSVNLRRDRKLGK